MKPLLVAGFTGTREGMTDEQQAALREMLALSDVLKHGDCQGADEEAHNIMLALGRGLVSKFIEIHPPYHIEMRAWCNGANQVFKPRPYLERNQDIVKSSTVLIAAPKGFEEEERSGTWSTVRYAKSCGKPIRIIFPDGKVERR